MTAASSARIATSDVVGSNAGRLRDLAAQATIELADLDPRIAEGCVGRRRPP